MAGSRRSGEVMVPCAVLRTHDARLEGERSVEMTLEALAAVAALFTAGGSLLYWGLRNAFEVRARELLQEFSEHADEKFASAKEHAALEARVRRIEDRSDSRHAVAKTQ